MITYVLIIISGILVYRAVQTKKNKKKVFVVYLAILSVGFFYNLGEVAGKFLYNIGFYI